MQEFCPGLNGENRSPYGKGQNAQLRISSGIHIVQNSGNGALLQTV